MGSLHATVWWPGMPMVLFMGGAWVM
ncbi:hypothetical protein Gorai_019444 [Gossypium raimondii]|uniref:Uncharacterized protein n=1 Tax=Gossypium raimondii TaxID=29730 RepID=A0A7J8PPF3_GOSRA|nr:hypothetical protein [Gossypium raimondii]